MLRLCDGFRRIDLCWDWLILPGAASAADVLPEPSLRAGMDPAPPAPQPACRQPHAGSGVPCAGEQAPFKSPWEQLSPLCNKAGPKQMGLCIRVSWGRAAGSTGSAGSWEGFSQLGGAAVICRAVPCQSRVGCCVPRGDCEDYKPSCICEVRQEGGWGGGSLGGGSLGMARGTALVRRCPAQGCSVVAEVPPKPAGARQYASLWKDAAVIDPQRSSIFHCVPCLQRGL